MIRCLAFVALAFCATGAAQAQTAATATSTATVSGTCKDGTSFSAATKRGACSRHGGIASVNSASSAATATATSTPPPAPMGMSKPATTAKSTASSTAPKGAPGPGQVWVNTASKVYHCPGTKYYGKTKQGEYMTESQATSQGFRASRGKTCAS